MKHGKTSTSTLPPLDSFNSDLAQKIIQMVPALIVVYQIKTGKYIFVSDSVENILGYKKNKIQKLGLSFVSSLVHPEDLEKISKLQKKALMMANSKDFNRTKDKIPVTFEYRVRHINGSWRWFHSDGIIFSRDSKGQVDYVMNISIDITDNKNQEFETNSKRVLAENLNNSYLLFQLKTMSLRTKIADIIRQDFSIEKVMSEVLDAIVKNLPAAYSRLWLSDDKKKLHLTASAGTTPPNTTIKTTIRVGDFAVGEVAKLEKPLIVNDIYQTKGFQVQNIEWSKKNQLIAFAGYPLIFKNNLIGVISIFSKSELSENTLVTLAYVADILAQEIERRKVEQQLKQSQERYLAFISQSSEAIWRIELEKPVSVKLPPNKQIDLFYKYGYLAECNEAMAKMYGFEHSSEILGVRLGDLVIRNNPDNIDYLKNFIKSFYMLSNAESFEKDKEGNYKYFQNNLVGIVENNQIIRAWGTQKDITEQKKAQDQLTKLSKQKDEFIAIASHELKTPITSLKAYTQILERKSTKNADDFQADILNKMDFQINKITGLISDLLDISKMEAGKMQFNYSNFSFNQLIEEICDQLEQSTKTHQIIKNLAPDVSVDGDSDRIGQVMINFISNAIKYSPKGKKIIIKTHIMDSSITFSVQDFGIGISKHDQKYIFERFYRSSDANKKNFPGLGLGLYICQEIILKHQGGIKVQSQKGKGSIFSFTLPVKTKLSGF